MKKISILFLAAIVTLSFFTAIENWKSDKGHSQLGFTHLGISDVTELFKNFDVTIKTEKPDFSDAVLTLTAEAASINTGIDMRDNHLKSADFFDVVRYPTIAFKSSSLKANGNNKYKVTGDLSLHGVTKPMANLENNMVL